MSSPVTSAGSGPPSRTDTLDLGIAEVKQLYEFLDGGIMVPDVRHHLWRSWGFCARHAWGYATVELELGLRDPFSLGILYVDLIERAVRLLQSRRKPAVILRRLQSHDSCFTCDYLEISKRDDPRYLRHQRQANRRARTRQLLRRATRSGTVAPARCATTGKAFPADRTSWPAGPSSPGVWGGNSTSWGGSWPGSTDHSRGRRRRPPRRITPPGSRCSAGSSAGTIPTGWWRRHWRREPRRRVGPFPVVRMEARNARPAMDPAGAGPAGRTAPVG